MSDRSPADLTRQLQDLLHQSANDTSVLLALADLAQADPSRVPELLAEVRRRCPRLTETLRAAAAAARGLPTAS